jgi:bla regulator protein blaR1
MIRIFAHMSRAKLIRPTLCAFALASASAQQPPGFEVASVKPSRNNTAESNLDSAPGGRLTATNITVRELIRLAYSVKDYQIKHAPGWLEGERYDIAAKSAIPAKRSLEEEQAQVRALLIDRFHLTTHRETKQAQVYLLVIAKDGPKLTVHNEGTGSGTRKACGHLAGKRLTTDTIATLLSRQFEREVLNRTGLPGKYDFQLDWTPDSGPCPAAADTESGSVTALPSIFTAIQQQLGLKLESSKGPVEFLVIDRVERPSAN